MKIIRWIIDNIFFLATIFLLAFIPLYPKKPLLDIMHTWVYIRIEDFIVLFIVLLWIIFLFLKKVTLKTPLTLPILLFWIIGGVATLHGVLVIFPTIPSLFSNVALLSFLRRIEYISLFFVAYAGMRDKRFMPIIVGTLTVTLVFVILYGFGQRFLGFPAFLTMNEEFAKGVPIQLSQLSRVPSTFAGHYDLAAYLVLVIPILISMAFGLKNYILKSILLIVSCLGFVLLFMTVSRVSLFVFLLSAIMLLVLLRKKLILISLFAITIILLILFPSLLQRFGNTIKEVNVLVDAKTGEAIGPVKEVPSLYFKNKIITMDIVLNEQDPRLASSSGIVPFYLIPPQVALVTEPNSPTGEDLPQGTGYINLSLSPITGKVGKYFYQKSNDQGLSNQVFMYYGNFLIKRALAYDLSFTTRFQGEWPNTIKAFKRNIFLGNGYGSVSLAVDNNYLRILGESGLFGLFAFISIFLAAGIYIKKILPNVDSPLIKNFILGFIAGTFGLALNAILIDVFEASKIAFTFWLLVGIVIGILGFYKTKEIDILNEIKKIIFSSYAVVIYLFIVVLTFFSSLSSYYFVGDDFTWFRWVEYKPTLLTILSFFTEANGFFYRPGAKIYFSTMYQAFWLDQTMYHIVSIFLHFVVATLLFLISKRVLKNYFLAAAAAFLFVILSGYLEAVFWISATGFLFATMFVLLSLFSYILWGEKKKIVFFAISVISSIFSLFFHEFGVVTPLLIVLYAIVIEEKNTISKFLGKPFVMLFFPIFPYLILRFIAQSHWYGGDYSYNLFKLPFNMAGNAIGYFLLTLFGPESLPFYQALRVFSKEHMIISVVLFTAVIFFIIFIYKAVIRKMVKEDKKIVLFGSLFFIIALLPFLGLGNIASRYSYLSSVGFIFLFIFLVKKAYYYFLSNGKVTAIGCIIILMLIFLALHLFQLQKTHRDWEAAGNKSKKFIASLNQRYSNDLTKDNIQFYFINVPIRMGEAWVFPVGLNDAVWFIFRNKNLSVYQLQSVEQAFSIISKSRSGRVFKFEENGKLVEMAKTQSGEIIPLMD